MPTQTDLCPILGRYLQELMKLCDADTIKELYGSLVEEISELADGTRVGTREVQLLRAFYCMEVVHKCFLMTWPIKRGHPIDVGPPERNREWLTRLIRYAEFVEKDSSVAGVELKIMKSRETTSWELKAREERLKSSAAGLALEASQFLRPKLKNNEDLDRMGCFLAEATGLSSTCLRHAHNLSNIREDNGIRWL